MRNFGVFLIFMAAFQGCTTLQHMVPGRPLKKNEVECRLSLGVATNHFNLFSLQFAAFTGLTDNDALGFTFANPLVPSSVSYVRYWGKGDYSWNYQFHINNLWGSDYNPEYETDVAFSRLNRNSFHSIKIGVGLYTPLSIPYFLGEHFSQTAFVPIVSYQFRNPAIRLEAEAMPGMSEYFVKRYKSPDYLYSDADSINELDYTRNTRRIYDHDEVKEISQVGEDYDTAVWIVTLSSGDTLRLDNYAPHSSNIDYFNEKREFEAYKASGDNRILWLYAENKFHPIKLLPVLIEVNMKKVIADFNSGKDLYLLSDKDLIKNTLKNINPVTENLFFSIGHDWRGN